MESKRPIEPECSTALMKIGVIGVNVFMGVTVCSLLMAHHHH